MAFFDGCVDDTEIRDAAEAVVAVEVRVTADESPEEPASDEHVVPALFFEVLVLFEIPSALKAHEREGVVDLKPANAEVAELLAGLGFEEGTPDAKPVAPLPRVRRIVVRRVHAKCQTLAFADCDHVQVLGVAFSEVPF